MPNAHLLTMHCSSGLLLIFGPGAVFAPQFQVVNAGHRVPGVASGVSAKRLPPTKFAGL